MKIRWNGHSSFTITANDGTVIVTDPYKPGAFGGGIGYQKIDVEPDIVTVSHEHDDHNYVDGFRGPFEVVRDSRTVKGIELKAVDSFHDENEGKDRGLNKIISFTVDGISVCHLGDLGHPITPEQVSRIGKVDVLFVPVGGYYTIDHFQAVDAVHKLLPKVIIPMHFKTDKCGFPISEVSEFTKEMEEVREVGADEVEINPEMLPQNRTVFLLDYHY